MFQGARALHARRHHQRKKENSAKPKEGQEPFINMHLKQSRSFGDRT